MSSEEAAAPESRSQVAGWIIGIVGLLFVAYPLSVGPALYMQRHDWISLNTLITIYAPLETLAKAIPPIESFFEWYVGLWR